MQHYYSVRIFPGQEPSSVWVGWVTSDFHQYDPSFELHNVRTVTVTLGDEKGKVHERLVTPISLGKCLEFYNSMPVMVRRMCHKGYRFAICLTWFESHSVFVFSSIKRSNCYMVWAGESSSPGQGRNNNGLEIGCLVDTANGLLTFTANGKELSTYYQVNIWCGVTGFWVAFFFSSHSFCNATHFTILFTLHIRNLPPLFLLCFSVSSFSQHQLQPWFPKKCDAVKCR